MRPAREGRENLRADGGARLASGPASMRPAREGRENAGVGGPVVIVRPASMRPAREGRENILEAEDRMSRPMLQ